MAYDDELARRVRELLTDEAELTEGKMFGGLAFLLRGHMAVCASSHGGLMVRVDPAVTDELIATTPAEPMEMRGSSMRGWVRVAASAVRTDADLREWVARGVAAATALPAKASGTRPKRPRRATVGAASPAAPTAPTSDQ